MMFPQYRPRRMRANAFLRSLISETTLDINKLIYPVFVVHGNNVKEEIKSMPGIYRFSIDTAANEIKEAYDLGIKSIILFGIPERKDNQGSEAWSSRGIVQNAITLIKKELPDMIVITDVCLCEYTSHGHCGILKGDLIQNDITLEMLAKTALSHARAGADIVAPSDMMDGRVGAIREALDEEDFDNIPIMAYSVKYASAFYGPFRDAANCAPKKGDRSSYQMDPANKREALREATLDLEEGADILMVKPAMPYLDIIHLIKQEFTLPVAAYQVSGEYAMIKAAAINGWIDEERVVKESLLSIFRAGADMILTYFAKDIAGKFRK
jgi:porphobilinogen synthase